jgi:predicted Fe-Mo cluster-binding NifX family protein
VQKLQSRGVQVIQTGEKDPLQAIADLRSGKVKPTNPHACNHHHHHQGQE